MKHGIAPQDFFDGLVEAWKHHESTCGNLSIERRKKTRDNPIFLITNNGKVVAQFSIPKHILEESDPLEGVAQELSSVRNAAQEGRPDHYQIEHLRPGMGHLNIKVRRSGKVSIIKNS
jgi:hypothetical protein